MLIKRNKFMTDDGFEVIRVSVTHLAKHSSVAWRKYYYSIYLLLIIIIFTNLFRRNKFTTDNG